MATSYILILNLLFLPLFLLVVLFINNLERSKKTPITSTKILDLRVYPIKSCRGFSVKSTRLLRTGVDLDRQYMFVTAEDNKFITIRQISKMTLINTGLSEDGSKLLITTPDPGVRIEVPSHPTKEWLEENTSEAKVEIWGQHVQARAYPASLSKPISDFLGKPVLLVYKGPWTEPRVLRGSGAPKYLGRTQSLGFADMLPTLVGSLASMAELNSRLRAAGIDDEWSIERFRPNIIVQGNTPWEEDIWKTLRIVPSPEDQKGTEKEEKPSKGLVLNVISRCLRCRVPNVDPNTAVEHKTQPWDTLMKYRRIDKGLRFKPAFGMLCAPYDEGEIKVGMTLEVLETTNDHVFMSPMA
jgi:uncharacterized protein